MYSHFGSRDALAGLCVGLLSRAALPRPFDLLQTVLTLTVPRAVVVVEVLQLHLPHGCEVEGLPSADFRSPSGVTTAGQGLYVQYPVWSMKEERAGFGCTLLMSTLCKFFWQHVR